MGFELLASFKSEAKQLRVDIDHLMNDLMEQVEESHKDVQPEIRNDYKEFKAMIKQQRIENVAIKKLYEKE